MHRACGGVILPIMVRILLVSSSRKAGAVGIAYTLLETMSSKRLRRMQETRSKVCGMIRSRPSMGLPEREVKADT